MRWKPAATNRASRWPSPSPPCSRSPSRTSSTDIAIPASSETITHDSVHIVSWVNQSPMFHIVLYRPEIPPNTGNIIRLCANTGCTLHLIRPLGFDIEGNAVRRAGLDYDELAQVRVHASLDACLGELPQARVFCVETGG